MILMKTSITQIYEEIMNYYIKKVQQMINEKEIEETMNINKIVKRLREISNEMNLMTIRLLYKHIDEKIALYYLDSKTLYFLCCLVLQGFRLCGVDRAFRSPWTFGKISPPYKYS